MDGDKKGGDAPPAPEAGKAGEVAAPAPALLIVSLPADAVLTVDNAATRATSAQRRFVTPALEAGKEYVYTLRAEIVRDNQTYSTTRTITVRAGAEQSITLDIPTTTVAAR